MNYHDLQGEEYRILDVKGPAEAHRRVADGMKSLRKRKTNRLMRRPSAARQKTANDTDIQRKANNPAIVFDLDGTLFDSNYEHVLAWRSLYAANASRSECLLSSVCCRRHASRMLRHEVHAAVGVNEKRTVSYDHGARFERRICLAVGDNPQPQRGQGDRRGDAKKPGETLALQHVAGHREERDD